MVAFTFDPIYHSTLVFLSAMIPGIALGWPLLKNSKLAALEKLALCFFLGLFAVPTLLFLEALMGVKFSLPLVIADLAAITITGMAFGIKNGAFVFSGLKLGLPKDTESMIAFAKAHGPSLLLLLAMLLSFWIRLQPYSPIYSELDPYFYVYGTGQIIREGMVPPTDDTAWWPEVQGTHRTSPLKMYLEAEWYSLYTKGGNYDNYVLFTTSSWLPPISAAFVSFGAYLLVVSLYDKKYGIFAAFLMAFLPSTIFKMSAGVNEAAPIGMMMMFLTIGSLSWALAKKDTAMRWVVGIAFFVTIAASNFQSVVALPFAVFFALQAIEQFIKGKQEDGFLETGAIAFIGITLGSILAYKIYANSGLWLGGAVIMSGGAILLTAAVKNALKMGIARNTRVAMVFAIALICMIAFFITPFGNVVTETIRNYLGAIEYKTALERTIAEQNLAGEAFEGEGGFVALLPKNHIDAGNKDAVVQITNAIYGFLEVASVPFTMATNLIFRTIDALFGFVLGTELLTSTKSNTIFAIFFICSLGGLATRHVGKKDGEELASVSLLLLLLMVPILYVGMNKIKFTVYAGMMIALCAVTGMAEMEAFFAWLARKIKIGSSEKLIAVSFSAILLLTAYAQAAGPIGYGRLFLLKSFESRYQDDPVNVAPKVSKLCEDLVKGGIPYEQVSALCDAGNKPNYASTIERQFDPNICWLSQMTANELLSGKGAEAATSARFRCNRLGDYWVDSMEWINKNLDSVDRVTSWWDYGHWINYFGDKKTVLRNEHASRGMIGRIAHDYIIGSTDDLIKSMNYYDSKYVLFDVELIGGGSFGGKYGALNYLGCVQEGDTSLQEQPGTSTCEYQHSPERIVIPKAILPGGACTISESQQIIGIAAYRIEKTGIDQSKPAYCIGEVTLKDGNKISATYYIDKKDENGNLILSKGFVRKVDDGAQASVYELIYNDNPIWPSKNGSYTGGMEDAKTAFYTSNLYKGFYLEKLPGFDLAYKSSNGEVKIYRMQNFTGNIAGWIDPAYYKIT